MRIGPYRIRGVLGTGGMGIVYDAVHGVTGEPAAVKTLRSFNRKFINGLRTEVLALRGVSHPLVVSILEDGLLETPPWYSMQRIEGRTLAEFNAELWGRALPQSQTLSVSSEGGELSPGELSPGWPCAPSSGTSAEGLGLELPRAAGGELALVLEIFCRLCEPLWHVHARGIVHRDLKPSNILLGRENSPIIMDFGLASRSLSSLGRGRLEMPNDMGGSAPYIAPEQVRGEFVDARADLYAFGCILYEAVTGRPPFLGTTHREVALKHLSETPLAPSQLVHGLPSEVEQVILRLLEKDPKARIGHADHLANALASAAGGVQRTFADVRAPAHPYLYRPALAGRDEVIGDISQACANARAGIGSLMFIGGESGIGKTFLAVEGGRLASLLEMQVVTGECQQLSLQSAETEARAGPLHPFRRLMQLVADRCREQPKAVSARLVAAARTLLIYEPALASVIDAPSPNDAPALPPEAARRVALGALQDMLELLALEGPVLLIVDDVQWADELSLAFIESLSNGFVDRRAVILICLYRVEEAPPELTRMVQRDGARAIRLPRLGADNLASLISDMLAMDSVPGELVEFIHRRSEGNPFFAAEYLRVLADEGVIRRSEGAWSFAGPTGGEPLQRGVEAPESIVDLVRRRLTKLGDEARRVARAGAIMGREFEDDALAAVAGVAEASLGLVLRELETNQVLEPSGEGVHRFVHDQLRAVISVEVAVTERRRYHRAFGHVLRERPDADLYLPELAHHFREAGELGLAVEYLEKAGYQALSKFANGEAVKFFKELLDIGSSQGQQTGLRRARWEKALGEALHGLGRLDESGEHLKRAATLLGYPVAEGAPRSQLELVRQLVLQLVHRASSRDAAHPDATQRVICREASQTYDRLSQIAYYRGQPLDMFNATLHTLNLAERGGPSPELATAYAIAHAVAGIMPIRSLAETYLANARATLSEHPDPCVDSYLQLLTGVYRSGTGEWQRARAAIDRGLDLAQQLSFQRRRDELRLALANWHFLLGQWDEALLQAAPESEALRQQDPQAEAWRHLMVAQVALVRGPAADAREPLRRAGALRAQLQRSELIWLCALEAHAAWAAGAEDEARQAATAALDHVLGGPPVTFYCIEAYSMVCDVWLGLWQAATPAERAVGSALERKARSACKAMAAFARVFPAAVPRHLLRQGQYAWHRRRAGAARQSWGRGVLAARRLELPHDGLLLQWELARALPRASASRDAQRAEVLSRAEALRAAALVARVKQDLE